MIFVSVKTLLTCEFVGNVRGRLGSCNKAANRNRSKYVSIRVTWASTDLNRNWNDILFLEQSTSYIFFTNDRHVFDHHLT